MSLPESRASMARRLNLGCGNEVLDGFVNVDIHGRPGIDVVHDLTKFPWPLPDNHFDEVRFQNVLEHLPDTIRTIEEMWRVCAPNAAVDIRVPYWNSRWAWMDPQHVRPFHECTFDFFDPSKKYFRERPYYSNARFHVDYVVFEGCWFWMALPWKRKVLNNNPSRFIHLMGRLSDTVHFLNFRLVALKSPTSDHRT